MFFASDTLKTKINNIFKRNYEKAVAASLKPSKIEFKAKMSH